MRAEVFIWCAAGCTMDAINSYKIDYTAVLSSNYPILGVCIWPIILTFNTGNQVVCMLFSFYGLVLELKADK